MLILMDRTSNGADWDDNQKMNGGVFPFFYALAFMLTRRLEEGHRVGVVCP